MSDHELPTDETRDRERELINKARSAAHTTQTLAPSLQGQSRWIGEYRVLGILGKGGMGVVYEAEQQNPRRMVALKVLSFGARHPHQQAKFFQREVQSLARLKHPSIAAIHEAGTTPDGDHFFAMELVRGERLMDYVERLKPSTKERLNLFHKICEAISYAHLRGVVHRDLKPSNILVDGDGSPKILDFGLARLTDSDLSLTSISSEIGAIIGTLPYMSPEQARGDVDVMDLRTDIYSLGVLLYELTTGQLPYNLNRAMLFEAVRVICEEPPKKPSTINRTLRGDIETIALKALEKDPSRRYQTAAALAEDVGRYLTNQPILARRASAAYQFRKLVMRHKMGFGFLTSLFIVSSTSAIWMGLLYSRVNATLSRAIIAEKSAADEAQRARLEAKTAERVTEFLIDLFKVIDPSESKGNTVTAREIVDRGAQRIMGQLRDEPAVQGKLLETIGRVYTRLGLFVAARSHCEASLAVRRAKFGDTDLSVSDSLFCLANVLDQEGDYARAETLEREALEIRKTKLGERSRPVAEVLNALGLALLSKGDYAAAEPLLREAVSIWHELPEHETQEFAAVLNNLGLLLRYTERTEESKSLFVEALRIGRKTLGEKDIDVAVWISNLASIHQDLGDFSAAEPLFEQSLSIFRELLGDDHINVITLVNNLGLLYYEKGEFTKAEPMLREAVEGVARTFGPDHPNLATAQRNLGRVLSKQGHFDEAESLLRESLEIIRKQFGPDHVLVGEGLVFWGENSLKRGTPEIAEARLREAVLILEKAGTIATAQLADAQGVLGECLNMLGRHDEAEPLLIQSHSVVTMKESASVSKKRRAVERLIELYDTTGRANQAEEFRTLLESLNESAP